MAAVVLGILKPGGQRLRASGVYAYLGGPSTPPLGVEKPEDRHDLQNGAFAIGCVRGGFQEAAQVLTTYQRRSACAGGRTASPCAVIFATTT